MKDHKKRIVKAVTDLDLEGVPPLLEEALESGEKAQPLLDAMCKGMGEVGKLFEKGEYYLADLVLAGEVMKGGLKVIEPLLAPGSRGKKGTVVLCTVKGDIHDIGKNLVNTMLSTAGFQVVDLGVDVPTERVVEAVRKHSARAVGLSVLLTTMVASVGEIVQALEKAGLRKQVKIAIGGACTTPELAKSMGVDGVGRDAVGAVRLFESFLA